MFPCSTYQLLLVQASLKVTSGPVLAFSCKCMLCLLIPGTNGTQGEVASDLELRIFIYIALSYLCSIFFSNLWGSGRVWSGMAELFELYFLHTLPHLWGHQHRRADQPPAAAPGGEIAFV